MGSAPISSGSCWPRPTSHLSGQVDASEQVQAAEEVQEQDVAQAAPENVAEAGAEAGAETEPGAETESGAEAGAEAEEEKPGMKGRAMKKPMAAQAAKAGHGANSNGGKSKEGKSTKDHSHFVATMIENFLQKPLPTKNEAVSEHRPLVFMHQHRAGGTTLRKLLYNETTNLKMKPHIQCSGGVDCRAFKNNVKDAAVYGGQFCWREMMTSLAGKEVSCLTNFREPVARITSCYMQRLVEKRKVAPACMAKLDTKQLLRMRERAFPPTGSVRRADAC